MALSLATKYNHVSKVPRQVTAWETVYQINLWKTIGGPKCFLSPCLSLQVDYRTEDGTANAGSDYEFAEGTLVFKPGETVKELTVGVIDDDIFEEDEHFYVHLSNPRIAHRAEVSVLQPSSVATGNSMVVGPSSHVTPKAALGVAHTATVTIYDDDHAGIFTFESEAMRVSESVGTMQVKVHRTSGARGKVAVPYHTVEGTARIGDDYEEVAGKLEFQNDETM